MTNRTDRLSEDGLQTFIFDLKSQLDAFKGRQRTSGASNILAYRSENQVEWDLSGSIGTDADALNRTTNFSAHFVGDGSQSPLIGTLTFTVFVQMGPDPLTQLSIHDNIYNGASGRWAALQFGSLDATPTTMDYEFTLFTYKEVQYFIKASANASSRGTVSVTSL